MTKTEGGGTFLCDEGAIHTFLDMRAEAPGLTGEEYLQMALERGILRNP